MKRTLGSLVVSGLVVAAAATWGATQRVGAERGSGVGRRAPEGSGETSGGAASLLLPSREGRACRARADGFESGGTSAWSLALP
jgi:hypothetical protein